MPSHISQPLDVSFFKPLKVVLEKACSDYHLDVKLISVLAGVFNEVWIASVRMSIVVNGFQELSL